MGTSTATHIAAVAEALVPVVQHAYNSSRFSRFVLP